jgi:hypothetical protein
MTMTGDRLALVQFGSRFASRDVNVSDRYRTKEMPADIISTVQKEEVLSLIDRHPMTVNNVANALGITESLSRKIFESLLKDGYIHDTKYNLFQRRSRRTRTIQSNEKSVFTLTTKGFFKKHPVLVRKV